MTDPQDMRAEVIEAMARAIFGVFDDEPWEETTEHWRVTHRLEAKAALDALLARLDQPSEAMVEAGARKLFAHGSSHGWFAPDSYDALDPIGRDEFNDIAAEVVSEALSVLRPAREGE